MKFTLKTNHLWLLVFVQLACMALFGYHLNRTSFPELLGLYSILILSFIFILKWYEGPRQHLFYAGLLLRAVLIISLPNLSQDFFRFIWDGRLLIHGYNPYIFLPDNLMKDVNFLLPEARELYNGMGNLSSGHYTNYPPVNQVCFAIAALFAGKSIFGSIIVFKLLIIGADIGTYYFGKKILKQQNLPTNNIYLYFLNPLVIIELTGNLHFEGVMVFFLIWSIYLLQTGRLKWAAFVFALSISVKLLPLMLLPLLFRNLKFQKAFIFYSIVTLITLLLFLPFYSATFFNNYAATVSLWFVNFEFNASIYYLLREVGFHLTGYNIIHVLGRVTPIIVLLVIAAISTAKWNTLFKGYTAGMLFTLCFYFFLSTTVHPWYIITPLSLSVFTKYRFPLVWSFMIILSYSAYSNPVFNESSFLLIIEYAVVFFVLIWELNNKKVFWENLSLYPVRNEP